MQEQDNLLRAYLGDKMAQCAKDEAVSYSYFLDSRQQWVAAQVCRGNGKVPFLLWGGYEEAERKVCFFLPWYLTADDFAPQSEADLPLTLLRITVKGGVALTHRDYLGGLMGIGIKREMVGDILVSSQGADIVVFRKIVPYIAANYEKAGRASLDIQEIPFSEITRGQEQGRIMQITVASLRLDVVAAAVFHLSRGQAAEAVSRGQIFLNGILVDKPEKNLQAGDKLVLRGKGRTILKEIGGKTRKDKISVQIESYF